MLSMKIESRGNMALSKEEIQVQMDSEINDFYERIEEIIQNKGFSRSEISRRMGAKTRQVFSEQVSKRMKRISLKTVLNIANKGLKVPLVTLFGEESHSNKVDEDKIVKNFNNILYHELFVERSSYNQARLQEEFTYYPIDLRKIKQGVLEITLMSIVKAHVVFGVPYAELLEGENYDDNTHEVRKLILPKRNENKIFTRYAIIKRFSFKTSDTKALRDWILSDNQLTTETFKTAIEDYQKLGMNYLTLRWLTNNPVELDVNNYVFCSKRPKDKTDKLTVDGVPVRNCEYPAENTIIHDMVKINDLGYVKNKTKEQLMQLGFKPRKHKNKGDYHIMEVKISDYNILFDYLKKHSILYVACYYPEETKVDET